MDRQRTFEHPQGERSIGLELSDLRERLELPSLGGAMDLAQPRPYTDRTLALGGTAETVLACHVASFAGSVM